MNAATLKAMQASPAEFRKHLRIDSDSGPVRLADALDDWQRADFEALDPGWQRACGHNASGGYSRAWLERGRGHAKTSDQAVMGSYALFASRRRLSGVAAAADLDQAALLREAIAKLVQLNPWLGKFLTVQASRVVNEHTGSKLDIISSDAASSYGLTPDFVIADEVTHWKSRDLWDSLISAAAKRQNCIVVCILNAGWGDTWQWETREAIRQSAEWYFHRLNGPVASWLNPARLAEQQRLLPALVFARLWGNEWTSGSGDALTESQITAAVTLCGPIIGPEPGFVYVAGLDIGLSRDASALVLVGKHVGYTERRELPPKQRPRPAVTRALIELSFMDAADGDAEYESIYHPGTGKLRVGRVDIWHPEPGHRVELESVEAACLDLHRVFNLSAIAADPWQAAYLIERLQKANIPAEGLPFTFSNLQSMATTTLEAFGEQQIELYPHDRLMSDLRALRIEEKSYGVRLDSPRGPSGHGDAATALAIGMLAAKRFAFGIPASVQGELCCYP